MDREVAVVVGVGGMGQAIARRLSPSRRMVLADVSAVLVDSVATTLAADGHLVTPVVIDVSDRAAVAELAATASALGPVRVIVHTAGLSPVQASAEAILKVDLLGVAYTLEEFGHVVAPGGAGVVIASMAGHLGPPLRPRRSRSWPGHRPGNWPLCPRSSFPDTPIPVWPMPTPSGPTTSGSGRPASSGAVAGPGSTPSVPASSRRRWVRRSLREPRARSCGP